MVTTVSENTALELRHLTVDYSTGHALIDGRPIGTFIAEQGPEVLSSPAEDLYVVNVPLLVKSVTFLPSGEHFVSATTGVLAAFRRFVQAVGGPGDSHVSISDVRLALVQALPKDRAVREQVLSLLDDQATEGEEPDDE